MTATVHIIGAGLAGLSAAVRLLSAGRQVIVHEATAFAGGGYASLVTRESKGEAKSRPTRAALDDLAATLTGFSLPSFR